MAGNKRIRFLMSLKIKLLLPISLVLCLSLFVFLNSCGQSPASSASTSQAAIEIDFGIGTTSNNTYALSASVPASITFATNCNGYSYPINTITNNAKIFLPTGISCTLSLNSFQITSSGDTYTPSTAASVGANSVVTGVYTNSSGNVLVVTPVISGSLNPVQEKTSISFTYQSSNTVTASLPTNYTSLFGVVANYTGTIALTFKTNTSTASNLSVTTSSLPSGFSFSNNMTTCAVVDSAGSCVLTLSYTPSAATGSPATLSIPFSYIGTGGAAITGSLSLNYQGLSRMKWTYANSGCGAPILSTDGNTAYIVCSDGYIRAVNASTGSLIWSSSTAIYNIGNTAQLNSTGSAIYIQGNTSSGYVYSINTSTGAQNWTSPSCGGWLYFPGALNPAKTLFFAACRSGIVYAYNTSNGTQNWASANISTGTLAGSPVVSPDANRVYMGGGGNNRVYALNTSNGGTAWSYTTGGVTYGGPGAVSANSSTIYWASDKLYSLTSAGGLNWSVCVGSCSPTASALTLDSTGSNVYLSPADGYIYGLSTTNGTQTFKSAVAASSGAGNSVFIALSPDGKSLYMSCGDGYYRAFNIADGSLKWSYYVGSSGYSGSVYLSVSSNGNTIYVGGPGNAYALNDNVVVQ